MDGLGELLKDLKLKERYSLVKEQIPSTNKRYVISSRPSSRNVSTRHTRRPSLEKSSSPAPLENKDDWLKKQLSHFDNEQTNVVSNLESRMATRTKEVAAKIRAIEEEKKRLEEERKRKEEEERKRLEEERKRKEEAERKKKKEEERQRLEAEKKAKDEAEKKEREKKEAEKKANEAKESAEKLAKAQSEEAAKKDKGVTNFKEIETIFLHYRKMIHDIKHDVVLKVREDLPTKNAIMKHKRKINPKFGQLTNSIEQLQRISSEVTDMINETRGMEIAYKWILNFVAKAVVSQAETEVRAKPNSSVPLAKLALNLLCEFPELKDFLMARFVKKCPFVIGFTCDISTEEGRLRMGWKRHDDSKWEDEVTYDERMGGMMTLYSVLTRLPLDQKYFQNMQHPLPISENWKMIARLLNQPTHLLTNTHFIVASSWWEASADQFLMSYGTQGKKVLQILWTTWPKASEEKKFTGSKTLQTLGEDWSTTGKVKKFSEMER
jgi:nucleoporin GLE1